MLKKCFPSKRLTAIALAAIFVLCTANTRAEQNLRLAYISDSPGSSSPYWIAKEAGLFKKHGLDVELIFVNGSTRGIQSLVAGDIDFASAVGTSAINGKLAGGDIVIFDSLVNTLSQESDREARKRAFNEIQSIMADETPAIPIVSRHVVSASNTRVGNLSPASFLPYSLWNAERLFVSE